MAAKPLFTPLPMGDLVLPNRVLMAPLTRNRAQGDGTPKDMAVDYYRQRASAGAIFSEATQVSAMGKGYLDTPGIHTDAQIEAWGQITEAVHAAGGRILCQLWHVGRISHVSLLPEGRAPVSSTARAAQAQTFATEGMVATSKPEALTVEGIEAAIAEFRAAALAAKAAGFDGVEVHAANGYLLDQFIQDGVNDRTDDYGGSLENRLRFPLAVLDAVIEVWGAGRTGMRLSPLGQFNDMSDSDPEATFRALYEAVGQRGPAFLHVVEAFPGTETTAAQRAVIERLRKRFAGTYIANGGYDGASGEAAVASGHADAITFGRPFLANPDLPERLRVGAELNAPNPDTFYGGGREGYTDYPFLGSAA